MTILVIKIFAQKNFKINIHQFLLFYPLNSLCPILHSISTTQYPPVNIHHSISTSQYPLQLSTPIIHPISTQYPIIHSNYPPNIHSISNYPLQLSTQYPPLNIHSISNYPFPIIHSISNYPLQLSTQYPPLNIQLSTQYPSIPFVFRCFSPAMGPFWGGWRPWSPGGASTPPSVWGAKRRPSGWTSGPSLARHSICYWGQAKSQFWNVFGLCNCLFPDTIGSLFLGSSLN